MTLKLASWWSTIVQAGAHCKIGMTTWLFSKVTGLHWINLVARLNRSSVMSGWFWTHPAILAAERWGYIVRGACLVLPADSPLPCHTHPQGYCQGTGKRNVDVYGTHSPSVWLEAAAELQILCPHSKRKVEASVTMLYNLIISLVFITFYCEWEISRSPLKCWATWSKQWLYFFLLLFFNPHPRSCFHWPFWERGRERRRKEKGEKHWHEISKDFKLAIINIFKVLNKMLSKGFKTECIHNVSPNTEYQ